ncbi:hypothetical protein BCY86_01690 [Pajaroellobacter abortibovis]|uniref:Tetrapyrrole biosynthesis uroporphyrinogen III synthase domain-containing protein n=2 Tax=Pajaroellobacter abortibovis TaxID=1882918 RepID=A0A1L6MVN3_9BACT|nr:hypothetical protein BCY86_01690 [Pajaroellobacter abortibovis]
MEDKSLQGKRILITRAQHQAEETAVLVRSYGAEPLLAPMIALRPPPFPELVTHALHSLPQGYLWVLFTSVNGVEWTWKAIIEQHLDASIFKGVRLGAIGPATARALESKGLKVDVVAQEFRGEGLAKELIESKKGPQQENRVLILRALEARQALPNALRLHGYQVDVVAVYETYTPSLETFQNLASAFEHQAIDAVLLTSSSIARSLCVGLGERAGSLLEQCCVASIGPITTATLHRLRIKVHVTADVYTLPALLSSLAEYFAHNQKSALEL